MVRRRRSYESFWPRYVPVAERRHQAEQFAEQRRNDGRPCRPIDVATGGRAIARTFWGKAWCENLERYSDYASRLPRGRTYVRNGSVIDLQIAAGQVDALVTGSEIYSIEIGLEPLAPARWRDLRRECSGAIDSLVELLQGRFSQGVMEVLCRSGTGIFPEPRQITMDCSCPDWATMCKHVAAVLYGVGVRLDAEPELLFVLRQVDQAELISASARGIEAVVSGAAAASELAGEDLGALFGIDLDVGVQGVNGDRPDAVPRTPISKPGKPARPARAKAMPTARPKARPKARPVARSETRSKTRSAAEPWIGAAELRERGVPNSTVQGWLRQGLLTHTGERGFYWRTKAGEELVRGYLTSSAVRRRRKSSSRLPR